MPCLRATWCASTYLVPETDDNKFFSIGTGTRKTVKTVVQVWKRRKTARHNSVKRFTGPPAGVRFLPKSRLGEANVLVRRLGSVRSVGQAVAFKGTPAFKKRLAELRRHRAATLNDFAILVSNVKTFRALLTRRKTAIRTYIANTAAGNNPALTTPEFTTLLSKPSAMRRSWKTHIMSSSSL